MKFETVLKLFEATHDGGGLPAREEALDWLIRHNGAGLVQRLKRISNNRDFPLATQRKADID